MTFIHSHDDLNSPVWLLNLPSQTLAQVHFGALPNGALLLTVDAEQPPLDDVFQSFSQAIESVNPGGSDRLVMCTRRSEAEIPHYILLCNPFANEVVIHYPALGFTAGVREDGSKIPPTWRHYQSFNRAQRSLIMRQAADTLMRELAGHLRNNELKLNGL